MTIADMKSQGEDPDLIKAFEAVGLMTPREADLHELAGRCAADVLLHNLNAVIDTYNKKFAELRAEIASADENSERLTKGFIMPKRRRWT